MSSFSKRSVFNYSRNDFFRLEQCRCQAMAYNFDLVGERKGCLVTFRKKVCNDILSFDENKQRH